MSKYRLIRDRLIKEGIAKEVDFVLPSAAKDEDVLLVHTPEYVRKLKEGSLSWNEVLTIELPYSPQLVAASWLCAGGTILTCQNALQDGISIHLGGGFHHAFSDHGEGFCVLNDVAIGVKRLQKDKAITRAMIVDCDLHQGNGTAAIFSDDEAIFTFSIHQENNYPAYKPPSDLDIGLKDLTGDEEYLALMEEHLPRIIEGHKPEFILYLAGADPYVNDQLGGLSLTMEGFIKRDNLVFEQAKNRKIPLTVVLAGGYALDLSEVVTIHYPGSNLKIQINLDFLTKS